MKALTLNDLERYCKQEIAKGRGDYVVMVSDDDECNGYHYIWSSFITAQEIIDEEKRIWGNAGGIDRLDEKVAPISKTIILS